MSISLTGLWEPLAHPMSKTKLEAIKNVSARCQGEPLKIHTIPFQRLPSQFFQRDKHAPTSQNPRVQSHCVGATVLGAVQSATVPASESLLLAHLQLASISSHHKLPLSTSRYSLDFFLGSSPFRSDLPSLRMLRLELRVTGLPSP